MPLDAAVARGRPLSAENEGCGPENYEGPV